MDKEQKFLSGERYNIKVVSKTERFSNPYVSANAEEPEELLTAELAM